MVRTNSIPMALESLAEAIMELREADTAMRLGQSPAGRVALAEQRIASAVQVLKYEQELRDELLAAGARVTFPEHA